MDFLNSPLDAMPIEGGGSINPRYVYKALGQPAKRETGYCTAGTHPCQDTGQTLCCPNDEYCYLDSSNQARCCAIGLECTNPCSTSLILCTTTITQSGTTTSTTSCCERPCPASSAFQCASSFGGGCCSVDSTCGISGTNRLCISTVDPSTSIASVSPTGCNTGQFMCPADEGGGCCDNGATCTGSGSALFCAYGTATTSAARTGPSGTETTVPNSHDLSTGAKTGIGVGVGLGFCLLLGAFTYFFITRRRSKQAPQITGGTDEVSGAAVPTSETSPASRLSPRSPGSTDYVGSMAREGPYAERDDSGVASPHSTDRGVPLSPQSPGDIAAPVEIADSKQTPRVPPPPPGYEAEHTEPIYELP